MIQGTSEDVAQRICNNFFFFILFEWFFLKLKYKNQKGNNGFNAVPKSVNDLGYFSQGIFLLLCYPSKNFSL